MRPFAFAGVLILVLLLAVPAQAAADTVSGATLLSSPEKFDGKQVTISGELVGDYGFRSDGHVWAQLNDDPYALAPLRDGGSLRGGNIGVAIRATADLLEGLDPPGRYSTVGPIVRVTGTWRYHDPGRGEETYLEVRTLSLLQPGRPVAEAQRPVVPVVGILLILATVGLLVLGSRRRAS